MNLFDLAVRSDAIVLITGPTGAGKSSLARRIHEQSARGRKPFVTVNLACLHEGTLESELFGHERGAFTGADHRRMGRFESAQGGTVFLDEIGELSPRLQARLLEFLQSKTLVPVGGNREIRLDVRIIVATHRDLGKAVAAGTFREDLFHRLRLLPLSLPHLVDIADDEFGTLVHGLLEEACKGVGRSVLRISEEVARRFESHSWPGNIRELKAVLEFAALASTGPEIHLGDLPPWMASRPQEELVRNDSRGLLEAADQEISADYHQSMVGFEREYLNRALKRYRGRVNHTARRIGLNKTTLIRRMRALGISVEELFPENS